ncbi:ExbD/TolR family protein [Pseudoprimorskyibacter insulae]|uniref:Biopolymer transport protein ExbD n=1 Tax=Pseudoprimorskyibacter insulae TaxID=1695997 RepID=A0A2R8AQI9_9RHOB|nr:biopolymer transporter ExbD [Pseudoprimorskyibacter insulae]SPF78368.1 hypothetical protein PRI8871_00967 [Pseudoprimorskyibacter insulae]
MLLRPAPRRPMREQIVPMINVVFLLLIFFLLSAEIAPPDPVEVILPDAEAMDEARGNALYLAADGTLAFQDLRGEAAMTAALQGGVVELRADRNAEARALAQTLAKLTALGATDIRLVTGARR